MRFIILSLALLCSTGRVCSQEEKLAFRTLALAQFKFPELWVMEAGKPFAIPFSSAQPSIPLQADKLSPLPVFMGPLDAKGLPLNTTPVKVPLPATSSVLLLGWMDGEKPGFLAIEDPFKTMKSDDWLVINSSKKQLALQIGAKSTPIGIKPNSNQAIRNTAPVDSGAAVTIATQQPDGKWKSVYTSYWPIYDNMRGLIVVVQKGERLNVNYISDKIAPAPVPKP